MNRLMKASLAALLVLGLCACGTPPAKTSNVTLIQPLSQGHLYKRDCCAA